jgi:hypothetical protein
VTVGERSALPSATVVIAAIGCSGESSESPDFAAAIGDVERRLAAVSIVTNIRSPLDPAHADQVSRDRHSAIVRFDVRGVPDTAADRVAPIVAAVDGARAEHPAVFIGGFGNATAEKEVNDQFNSDLGRAGLLSLTVTIVILIVAFGALVAAGIPLLLGLTAVLATMGLLAIPSQFWPVDEAVNAVVLLIGLAVGVDYSVFYLKREREERAAGRSESAALEAAAATSGRSVLISGRKPAESAAESTGLRRTRWMIQPQNRAPPGFWKRWRNGMRPLLTLSPSRESRAGKTVTDPSTAIATTRIVAIAKDMNVLSPVRKHPGHRGHHRQPGTGERVLRGEADRVELLGVDRWIGGTHVTPESGWRWDSAAQEVRA